jgi:hypothetical protein
VKVEDALAAYFEAYEQFRIEEILNWFLLPCHVVSDAAEVMQLPLATREACRAGVQRVLDWHRSLGAARSRIVEHVTMELSPRISCVDVKVDVEDGAGLKLYDFEAVYTFVRSGESWRVAAITHNQIPRLLRCVRAKEESAASRGERRTQRLPQG